MSVENHFSDAHQIWFAFTRLEPQVEKALPDLIEPLRQARGNVFALLSQKDQRRVADRVTEAPKKSFDELVEEADRNPNPLTDSTDALPRAPTGAVDNDRCPAPCAARPVLRNAYVSPRDPLEKLLTEVWEECLKVRPVGITDHFFELGGDRVLAARMLLAVEEP